MESNTEKRLNYLELSFISKNTKKGNWVQGLRQNVFSAMPGIIS